MGYHNILLKYESIFINDIIEVQNVPPKKLPSNDAQKGVPL
jgi:hypothetical protein